MYSKILLGPDPARSFPEASAGNSHLNYGRFAYWPLNEQSGTRYNALTARGIVSASFINASAQYLSTTPTIVASGNWSIAIRYRDTGQEYGSIFSDVNASGGNGVSLYSRSNNTVDLYVGYGGGQTALNRPSTSNAFHFAFATYNDTTKVVSFSVDNGTPVTTVLPSAFSPGLSASGFKIGRSDSGSAVDYTGLVNRFGLWSSTLTAGDGATLYNSGSGLAFSDLGTLNNGNLVAYLNLDEVNGTRNDSKNENHLASTNGVSYELGHLTDDLHLNASSTPPTPINRGPQATVAKFVTADSRYLAWSGTPFSFTGYAASFWMQSDLSGTTEGILGIGEDYAPKEIALQVYKQSDTVHAVVGDGSGSVQSIVTIPDTFWHHYFIWYNQNSKKIRIVRDGHAFGDLSPALSGTMWSGSQNVEVGRFVGGAPAQFLNQKLSRFGIWEVYAGSTDQDAFMSLARSLFNAGNGKFYDSTLTAVDSLTAADITPPSGAMNLLSYWNFDQTSGSRSDIVGTRYLNETGGTIGSAPAGPIGTVAEVVLGNAEYLVHPTIAASLTDVSTQGLSMAIWGKTGTSPDGIAMSIGKSSVAGGTGYCSIYLNSVSGSVVVASDNTSQVTSTSVASATSGDWHLYFVTYDPSDKKFRIYRDDALLAPGVTAALTNHPSFATGDNSKLFIDTHYALTLYWGGQLSRPGLWNRILSTAEMASLFSSGYGKKYDDLTASEKVGLVDYWNLDEVSGDIVTVPHVGSHAASVFTDNGIASIILPDAMAGAAANFVGASFTSFSYDNFVMPDSYTVSGWLKVPAAGSAIVLEVGEGIDVQTRLRLFSIDRFRHEVGDGDDTYRASTFCYNDQWDRVGWIHFIATYSATDRLPHIYINNGDADTADNTGPTVFPASRVPATLKIGAPTPYLTGQVEDLTIYNRVITAVERTALFNLGAGKFYPFS